MRYELGRCRMLELFKETGKSPQDVIDRTGFSASEVSDWAYDRKKMSSATLISVSLSMGWDIFKIYELVPIPAKQKRIRQSKRG